jgi:hypothetical protein
LVPVTTSLIRVGEREWALRREVVDDDAHAVERGAFDYGGTRDAVDDCVYYLGMW